MEVSAGTQTVISPSVHSSDPWISLKEDSSYDNFINGSQSKPPSRPRNSNHLLHILSESPQPSNHLSYSSAPPVWRFYPMAGKGLCSRRVEDVKMNRIDKHRAGRRRRGNHRRPFVFKSSPLAEGQGVGRFTHFRANILPQSSQLVGKSKDVIESHKVNFGKSQHLTHFVNQRNSTIQNSLDDHEYLQNPISSFSTISRNSNSHRQPLISRLSNSKTTMIKSSPSCHNSTNHYQSWEISLPKCALPKMGMFSN